MDTAASKYSCNVGDLVYIKSERDKQNIKNFCLVVDVDKEFTTIQKFGGSHLRLKKYLLNVMKYSLQ